MTVRYVRVKPDTSALFSPAARSYGTIAIVGAVTPPTNPPADIAPPNEAILFTNPDDALRRCPGDLGTAIALAFRQTPGPSVVYGVRTSGTDWAAALLKLKSLAVQIVALANTPLNTASGAAGSSTAPAGAIRQLVDHVTDVSNNGSDGLERIGVAMLATNETDPAIVAGALVSDRMVYIAHKSAQDAAAAVAGVIAGYAPSISLLLKPVSIDSDLFTASEIDTINGGPEGEFDGPPAGKGVIWLTHPALIPGSGSYLGEGYTGYVGLPAGGVKFIDQRRTIDDVSFRLKAQLIASIGTVRISRSGLRALTAQMEAVLDPLVSDNVLEGYKVIIPLLGLLDKNPDTLTPSETRQISNAHANRVVVVTVEIQYGGAIHRLAIKLNFS
ncbi:hypothetical protein IVB30_20195 [Bradyrhizobium sp. 200]|uniref:hypothetical protein n=1 Tax=Bradyrhizobium sp. 200 TaxID=2782665 RepID=UPI001FFE38E5|nr:hypothetical protein [Bradyrhizobium sp. 200]UPJ53429.1 hypothetical protein IVB30_20195 [Bradyrhizobium sp. 200]